MKRRRITASDDYVDGLQKRIDKELKTLDESYRFPVRSASEEFGEDVIPFKSAVELAKNKVLGLSVLSRRCFGRGELSLKDVSDIRNLVNKYGAELAASNGGEISEVGLKMAKAKIFSRDATQTGSRVASFARRLIVASERESKDKRVIVANKLASLAYSLLRKKED